MRRSADRRYDERGFFRNADSFVRMFLSIRVYLCSSVVKTFIST
jgi:hypothetical protein